MVKAHKGALFIGVTSLTDARAKKTGNPYGAIFKKSRFVGVSGADYAGAVNRAGAGEFEAAPLPWGEFVEGSGRKLIAHKGGLYLRMQSTGKQRAKRPASVQYYGGGRKLNKSDVAPFLPATNSAKQAQAGVAENEQVQIRTMSFDSLQFIRLNGKTFRVVKDSWQSQWGGVQGNTPLFAWNYGNVKFRKGRRGCCHAQRTNQKTIPPPIS